MRKRRHEEDALREGKRQETRLENDMMQDGAEEKESAVIKKIQDTLATKNHDYFSTRHKLYRNIMAILSDDELQEGVRYLTEYELTKVEPKTKAAAADHRFSFVRTILFPPGPPCRKSPFSLALQKARNENDWSRFEAIYALIVHLNITTDIIDFVLSFIDSADDYKFLLELQQKIKIAPNSRCTYSCLKITNDTVARVVLDSKIYEYLFQEISRKYPPEKVQSLIKQDEQNSATYNWNICNFEGHLLSVLLLGHEQAFGATMNFLQTCDAALRQKMLQNFVSSFCLYDRFDMWTPNSYVLFVKMLQQYNVINPRMVARIIISASLYPQAPHRDFLVANWQRLSAQTNLAQNPDFLEILAQALGENAALLPLLQQFKLLGKAFLPHAQKMLLGKEAIYTRTGKADDHKTVIVLNSILKITADFNFIDDLGFTLLCKMLLNPHEDFQNEPFELVLLSSDLNKPLSLNKKIWDEKSSSQKYQVFFVGNIYQYVAYLHNDSQYRHIDNFIRHLLEKPQHREKIQAALDEFNEQKLDEMAFVPTHTDRQSTHRKSVHRTVSKSALKLRERYKVFALDEVFAEVDRNFTEMLREAVKTFYSEQIKKLVRPEHLAAMVAEVTDLLPAWANEDALMVLVDPKVKDLDAFKYFFAFKSAMKHDGFVDAGSNLSLTNAIALVWLVLHDHTSFKTEKEQTSHRILFMNCLLQIRNEYGADDPACAAGTFNAVISFLDQVHPDVDISQIGARNIEEFMQVHGNKCFTELLPPRRYETLKHIYDKRLPPFFAREYKESFLQLPNIVEAIQHKDITLADCEVRLARMNAHSFSSLRIHHELHEFYSAKFSALSAAQRLQFVVSIQLSSEDIYTLKLPDSFISQHLDEHKNQQEQLLNNPVQFKNFKQELAGVLKTLTLADFPKILDSIREDLQQQWMNKNRQNAAEKPDEEMHVRSRKYGRKINAGSIFSNQGKPSNANGGGSSSAQFKL